MKHSVQNKVAGISRRIIAVFVGIAIILSLIGPRSVKAEKGAKQYIVLVLDASGKTNFYEDDYGSNLLFTAEAPLEDVREAALKFVHSLNNSSGDVYISIIKFGYTAREVCDFTNNKSAIERTITEDLTSVGGNRNLTDALNLAKEKLDSVSNENSNKSLILVAPGLVDSGEYSYQGHWSLLNGGTGWVNIRTGIYYYAYSNVAYQVAEEIKANGTKIYGIGMIHMLSEEKINSCDISDDNKESLRSAAQLFRNVIRDISSEGCFYPVDELDEFAYVFERVTHEVVDGSKGLFRYRSTNGGDYYGQFYFEDGYFKTKATKYNPNLATMSLCFAMSAFASDRENVLKYQNAIDLLESCGFSYIDANDDFKVEPHVDSMGVIIGHKIIWSTEGEFTLIALATRGAGYGNEWAGNFNVGLSGNHAGFEKAKDIAKDSLNVYIQEHDKQFVGPVKIWMAGYSRGAATVNLLAGEITHDQKIGEGDHEIAINKDNIFAYCFEAPRGLNISECSEEEAKTYTNIHNIINPNDLVPKVAMKEWDFIRYGVDEPVIPDMLHDSTYIEKSGKMMSYYSAIGGGTINNSFILPSEYEKLKDVVFSKLVPIAKRNYLNKISSGQGRVGAWGYRYFKDSEEWDDPNGRFQKQLAEDYYGGKITTSDGSTDFRDVEGEGIFPNAHDFLMGLRKIRSIYTRRIYAQLSPAPISKIDLFYFREYKYALFRIKGLVMNSYTPVFSPNPENLTSSESSTSLGIVGGNVLSELTKGIESRSNYFMVIQKGLQALMEAYYTDGGELDAIDFKHIVIPAFADALENSGHRIVLEFLLTRNISDTAIGNLYDSFLEELEDRGINIDKVMSPETKKEFRQGITALIQAIIDILKTQKGSSEVLSLFSMYELAGMAHYPELCLAWLQSQDSNYGEDNHIIYVPTAYRVIYINCPVDVEVMDSNGLVVASLVEDIMQETEGYVLYGVTADDAKRVYPIDTD